MREATGPAYLVEVGLRVHLVAGQVRFHCVVRGVVVWPRSNGPSSPCSATDGHIGKVEEATYDVGSVYLVVNCKPWLIGKHVLLPPGLVTGIDPQDETIHVDRSKDQIKGVPEYHRRNAAPRDVMGGPDATPQPDVMGGPDAAYRDTRGTYYGPRM